VRTKNTGSHAAATLRMGLPRLRLARRILHGCTRRLFRPSGRHNRGDFLLHRPYGMQQKCTAVITIIISTIKFLRFQELAKSS